MWWEGGVEILLGRNGCYLFYLVIRHAVFYLVIRHAASKILVVWHLVIRFNKDQNPRRLIYHDQKRVVTDSEGLLHALNEVKL